MGTRTGYAPGTFCWAELATGDAGAAKAFYGDLLGWTYDDQPVGEGIVYSTAVRDGHQVAALFESAQGLPRWSSFVAVASAGAVTDAARAAGATVVAEPYDVFDAGRMAVVADPTGAEVSLWQAGTHAGAALVNGPGALAWNDLLTADVAGACAFYAQVLGWGLTPVPGAPGDRHSISVDGHPNGGIAEAPPGAPAAWLPFFGVEDVEAAAERTTAGGGTVLAGPIPVPSGRFLLLADPQGATFGAIAGRFDP